MNIQSVAGLQKTIEMGVKKVREMLPIVNAAQRTLCPASELKVALQCGGSDAWSGITANPALGEACDLLVAQGGTGVLAETPEIYGAEHLLTERAIDRATGDRLIGLINWWEDYTARNRGSMDNNPSPGNKKGGLTTILEKSLGAAAKGGTTPLTGVYKYAEPVRAQGFTFMDSPGYDPASVTGQIAGGCNLVCFTTGRGSAFGSKPAPTIKLSTNTAMYERMVDDMDINCGDIITGSATIQSKGREIYELFLRVASGEASKSEAQGLGDYEFVPVANWGGDVMVKLLLAGTGLIGERHLNHILEHPDLTLAGIIDPVVENRTTPHAPGFATLDDVDVAADGIILATPDGYPRTPYHRGAGTGISCAG
jgi:altronate hydrolase